MLRAVLFDFNGVLVDDEPVHLALFQQIFRQEGIELSPADYYARLIGFDDRGCFRAVLAEAGQEAGPERLSRLIERKSKLYDRWVATGQLESHRAGHEWESWKKIALPAGFIAFMIGVVLLVLIYFAMASRLFGE